MFALRSARAFDSSIKGWRCDFPDGMSINPVADRNKVVSVPLSKTLVSKKSRDTFLSRPMTTMTMEGQKVGWSW
jgi:hypothetical protein